MGIPAPMVAGAIISGSYFGDKMSPLSDTTNLAAGLTNTDLFAHIRHMLFTTVPGLIITLIVYAVLEKALALTILMRRASIKRYKYCNKTLLSRLFYSLYP